MRRTLPAIITILCSSFSACTPSAESPAPPKPKAPPPPPAPVPEPVAPPAPARSFSDFRPSRHGFRFRNDFSGSPLPFSLGALEKHLDLPNRFGLCGGMSFAAADFFLANLEPPTLDLPPSQGHPLYDYLYTRQIDSLGEALELVPKFAKWMTLPDLTPKGTAVLTHAALPEILSRIETGEPTLLGLVLTSTARKGQLWQNHQVLAYAAEKSPDTLLIHIYDPNFPHIDDAALHITPIDAGDGSEGVHILRTATGRPNLAVRGFFLIPYTPKSPPKDCR